MEVEKESMPIEKAEQKDNTLVNEEVMKEEED